MSKEELMSVEIEEKLGKEVSSIEAQAAAITIQTDTDLDYAGRLTREVKAAQKKVDEYWKPLWRSSYDAYKNVNDHKNEMLDPLKKAEQILKQKITAYQMAQERKRREEEARIRKLAEDEAKRKLEEAVKAEESGDMMTAEYALAEAEAYDGMTVSVNNTKAKIDGISSTKSWKITGIDLNKLPTEYRGFLLRPADQSAIMRLIKETKGRITIPGVKFEETISLSVKAS